MDKIIQLREMRERRLARPSALPAASTTPAAPPYVARPVQPYVRQIVPQQPPGPCQGRRHVATGRPRGRPPLEGAGASRVYSIHMRITKEQWRAMQRLGNGDPNAALRQLMDQYLATTNPT